MIETGLALARWLQLAPAVLLCGAPAFLVFAAPRDVFAADRAWTKGLLLLALAGALAGALAMLLAESAEMSGDLHAAIDPGVIWTVASGTYFGIVWFVRLALLAVLAAFVLRFEQSAGVRFGVALFGGAFAASLAWQGHGGEGSGAVGVVHRIADVAHLLAASIWIGALVMLLRLLRRGGVAAAALRGLALFSGVGPLVVAGLIVTGLVNVWALTAPQSLAAAVRTPYAIVLALKLALFLGMLALAGLNRYALTPRLASALQDPSKTQAAVAAARRSLLIETALGALVLMVVAALGMLAPPSAI
jgi:putative copper resistance protein D